MRGYQVKRFPRWAEGTPLTDEARAEIDRLKATGWEPKWTCERGIF